MARPVRAVGARRGVPYRPLWLCVWTVVLMAFRGSRLVTRLV